MPIVEETEIDFDSMDDEQLQIFLDQLRAKNVVRRPVSKSPRAEAKPKAVKSNVIKVDL